MMLSNHKVVFILNKTLTNGKPKLSLKNLLHLKFAFLCRLLTTTAIYQQNYESLTSNVKEIMKAMICEIFLGPIFVMGSIYFFGFLAIEDLEMYESFWVPAAWQLGVFKTESTSGLEIRKCIVCFQKLVLDHLCLSSGFNQSQTTKIKI